MMDVASRAPTLGVNGVDWGSAFSVLGARDSTTLINSFAEHANVIHRQFWVVAKKRQTLPRICLNISTRDCENYSKSTCLNIASIRGRVA